MSFYQWYISILGSQIHVYSVFSVACCILGITYIQRGHPLIIRLVSAMFIVCLGHFIYEDIFILIMGSVGRSVDALLLYVLITIGIVNGMIIFDSKYHTFETDEGVFTNTILLLGVFGLMFYRGWFHDLQLWYIGSGPDPHNSLWAFSKLVGFVIPIHLLKPDNLKDITLFEGEEER